MAWERRGNRQYYYRKRREGRRVVSEYFGTGTIAELAEMLDAADREEHEREREAWRELREAELDLDREIDGLGDTVRMLTQAVLLASGHHTHKGQWRQRRWVATQ